MQDIYLTNSLTNKKDKFVPIKEGEVSIYSCGPTVYDYAHIGNFRSFLMSDLLFRVFKYAGYEVKKVQNITDVGHLTNDDIADADGEDKIAKKAKAEGKDAFEIARYYEKLFIEDENTLRIIPPNTGRPRATEFIKEQLELIKQLIEKEFAYEVNGSVYFRTAKFKDYGKLSGNKLSDLQAGARVEINSEKEDPLDFALWKSADKNHLMQWKSPWGMGFPGWHIECSAMSKKLLGKNFDIHTGGEDNIFPHHECEIAQNECSFGGKINYWLHAKHLLVDGKKMSKSKGNFYTIRDLLEEGWRGNEIRLALIKSHYKSSLNFSKKLLEESRKNIKDIEESRRICNDTLAALDVKKDKVLSDYLIEFKKGFQSALFDDLNIPEALANVFKAIKHTMVIKENKLERKDLNLDILVELLNFLENDFNQIFDIFPEEIKVSDEKIKEIEQKIAERNQARENKNWELSDKIRDELLLDGVELIDKAATTRWKIK